MYIPSFNLALLGFLLFFFESPAFSTDSDPFLDPLPDEIDPSSCSSLFSTSCSPDFITNDESFDNVFYTDDDDPLSLASCDDSNQPQLQRKRKIKNRKRDVNSFCPQNGATPLPSDSLLLPQFPDFVDSIKGPADSERYKVKDDGTAAVYTWDTPEFSCGLWTSKPLVYKKPVCGSGNYLDSIQLAPSFYSYVANSYLITTVGTFASCPPVQFFCCMQWLPNTLVRGPNAIPRLGTYDPSGRGTGYNCECPYDRGWPGLNL